MTQAFSYPKRRAIILAAGKGTRMNSNEPKVLTTLIDRPLLAYTIEALQEAGVYDIVVVVGYQGQKVIDAFQHVKGVDFVWQQPQLGTGHAVMQADHLKGLPGQTLVICGDSPCIRKETIEELFALASQADMVVLSARLDQPGSYGRILRDGLQNFEAIVEARDCSKEQLAIQEINSGIYCFNNQALFEALDHLTDQNAQKEYYLTDTASILKSKGYTIKAYMIADSDEILGVNTCLDLARVFEIWQKRINTYWATQGVQMERLDQVVIGKDVRFENNVLIQANTRITGNSRIGHHVTVGFGSLIHNAHINPGARIELACVRNTTIPANAVIQSGLWEDEHIL